MKRPNITPGPWKATNSDRTEIYAPHKHAPSEFVIPVASACFNGERRSRNLPHHLILSEAQANACAIAAVPALLEALERLWYVASLKLDQSATHEGLTNCKTLADARQALIKAGYEFDFAKQPD